MLHKKDNFMRTTALIFDFDGLIVDTETPDFMVLEEQYASYGVELRLERWIQGLGTYAGYSPYSELATLLGQELDQLALKAAHHQRYLELCGQSALQPGVMAILEEARERHLHLAVASSSTRSWVEGWLNQHQILDLFDCIRTRDDVQHVKPAPDLFLSAAACLEVEPGECVVFEDSVNGMRAAAAAGMRCVAVPIALLSEVDLPAVTMRLKSLDALDAATLLDQLGANTTIALQ